ncbi:serine-protein kinase RsbW [Streptomyces sp. YIM 130001]|uniref:ATP-binding protein n=1 Tax=Streptomyces sp. YIM 130001 TaxID=2259644 RepID=UPI000E654893|nr:ATP-binding protein [Streptomyces sp. YIM 130001]RII11918.1 serine-protein kinase RsbW [Streptomyces sp. YIM 130001]
MSIWWSLQLRREAESVPLARRLLRGAMDTAGVDPDISYDLSVALSEACANAVEHGGPTTSGTVRAASRSYRVTAYLDGEMCRIEVADSGPGFPSADRRTPPASPASADAEHGRGLCLIEEIADHVSFGNSPGTGGAVVSFDKILKWRDGALLQTV